MAMSAVKTCIRPASRIVRNNHIHNNTCKVALLHSLTTTTLLSNKNHNENVINQKGGRFTARRLLSTQMSDESQHNQPNGHAYENMNIMEQHHHHHHNFTPPQHQQDSNRTSFLMELTDKIGVLHDILRFFWKYDVNVTRIESRPSKPSLTGGTQEKKEKKFDFFVDVQGNVGDDNIDRLLHSLKDFGVTKLLVLDAKQVDWFPRHISELDLIVNRTLDANTSELQSDHPGFQDQTYRTRRKELAHHSKIHTWDQPIPHIQYTTDEIQTWTAVWDRMQPLLEKYACKEYLHALNLMKQHCNYSRDAIPQQTAISEYLQQTTNFQLRPVAGLLSSRDFLNGLAFRTFFCTQYIRHHSKPLYTPEPDICHELLGHAPMFANPDFCDFSQEIGLASLGASDEDVMKLARCYWFSVEFGLCKEKRSGVGVDGKDEIKAYGAGLLSSFGELEYACGTHENDNENTTDPSRPQIKPWDPAKAAMQEFPITTYQPIYYLAENLQDAKVRMRRYCEDLQRPFFAQYNDQTQTVFIDRPVRRLKRVAEEEE